MAGSRVERRLARTDLPLVRTSPGVGPIVIVLGLLILPVGLAVTLDGTTYDTWGAFVWGPILLALAFPLTRWVANRTGEPQLAGFLFGAAALKIVVGAVARYYIVESVYGAGDSRRYASVGRALSEPIRRGSFGNLGQITGTRFVGVATGVVQAIIGRTTVGSFLVFSAFGFVGMCLLYVAFCEALPDGDRTLYRRLLFLTPTMWFWPSSIGKEALLTLFIGSVALGFARMLEGHLGGLVLTALGMWGALVVRPHIALMLVIGAIAALVPSFMRQTGAAQPAPLRLRLARILVPVLVLVALPSVFSAVEGFFNIDGLNVESAIEARDSVVQRTSQGGSEFTAPDTNNPVGFLQALVTVVARPFPWEVAGLQVVASAELAVLMAVLAFAVARRRGQLIKALRQRWPRFALGYLMAFVWALSAVSNFGILARQRSLMFPFLFVLVASVPRSTSDDAGEAAGRHAQVRRTSRRPVARTP